MLREGIFGGVLEESSSAAKGLLSNRLKPGGADCMLSLLRQGVSGPFFMRRDSRRLLGVRSLGLGAGVGVGGQHSSMMMLIV
jgi:hypothetical protein